MTSVTSSTVVDAPIESVRPNPFLDGYHAYLAEGKTTLSNEHPAGSAALTLWDDGYEEARRTYESDR